jgi:thiamine biosynthesis lipoprotein ApbE/Na+-translocating ferredoxin:NAD+ oxidoreductase RnfG subunit
MARFLTAPSLLRVYRAAVLIAIAVLIHQQAEWFESQRATPISVRVARKYFPSANRVQLRDVDRGLYFVTDSRGDTIGCLLRTSPQTDAIVGYSGPNDILIALDSRGAINGVELLQSGDTREHVQKVRAEAAFWRRWMGWKPDERAPRLEAVSGATLTSFAIAEAIQQRLVGATPSLRFPEPVVLSEIQTLFTNASRMVVEDRRWRVFDRAGRVLGFAVRTSPQADNVGGYRGPTECLVALAPDGRTVTKVRIRRSYDTDSYVDQLRVDKNFLPAFVGRSIEELSSLDLKRAGIQGVSGATQTSVAVAEGIKRRAALEVQVQANRRPWRPATRDVVLAAVILGALVMSFTSLRGHRWIRLAWQAVLVGYVGLVSHDLLSLALFEGWAKHGVTLTAGSGIILLGSVAFAVPWATRRQIYCHQICPHGAAQQILGTLTRRRWVLSRRWTKLLEAIPVLLLAAATVVILAGVNFSLTNLEPFDAWVWKAAGMATLTLAAVGLVASIFIPQAYCRFGCPTGALLNFVRSTGSVERWSRRDWVALGFLLGAIFIVVGVRNWPKSEPMPEPTSWSGRTMGTTWSVKTFEEVADPAAVQKTISNELEWAESMISHWRNNTDISRFNQSRETNGMPVPWPVTSLIRRAAEISGETGGALDVTVGAMVKLWGFGPAPRRTEPPAAAEIESLLGSVGWQKIEVSDGMLRKRDPRTEVDLSCLAEGWAIDHVTGILQRRGYTNLLVEVGGEMRAMGRWTIAIEHPVRTCILSNEAIATSGTYRQNYQVGSQEISHLIDARTGRPVSHRTVSVSVRHAECMRADVWATALNVLGVDEGMPIAERLKLAAQFVVKEPDGKLTIRETSEWHSRAGENAR